MARPRGRKDDERMERIIGNLLRTGVLLSAVVVLGGGIAYLVRHGAGVPDYRVFSGEPAELRNVSGIVTGAWSLRLPDVIQLGLLLLIATPVARVAFAAIAFALERDLTYVAVSLVVLALLAWGLLGSGAHSFFGHGPG